MESIGYIEPLADVADLEAWQAKEIVAGFLTLRTAEDTLNNRVTAQQIETARQRASKVPRLSIRDRLLTTLDVLARRDTSEAGRDDIARALLAFAADLQAEGLAYHASVVCRTVEAQYVSDVGWRLQALQGIAYASRSMKKHAEAKMAYQEMLSSAVEHRETRMELEALLGLAKIAIERGNIPEAKAGVAKVLPRARRLQVRELIARALVDRGTINGISKDPVAAILSFNEALDFADAQDLRDHALFNIGYGFREVNFPVGAKDIAVWLWYNAKEAEVRWDAGVLRYNLAIDREDWRVASRVAEQLREAHLPPLPDAEYHEALARDHATRGLFEDARESALAMRDIAKRHEMFELVHRAERALASIDRREVPAIYEFIPTTTAARKKLAAVERSIAKLCAL